jgi:hypothetical protein
MALRVTLQGVLFTSADGLLHLYGKSQLPMQPQPPVGFE